MLDKIKAVAHSALISPIKIYKRDRDLQTRLKQSNTLTSKEIFQLEFGDKMPDFMKDNTEHEEREMEIIPSYKDPHASRFSKVFNTIGAYGYVYGKSINFIGMRDERDDSSVTYNDEEDRGNEKDRQIFINDVMFSKPGQALFGYVGYLYAGLIKSIMTLPITVTTVIKAMYLLDPLSSHFHAAVVTPFTSLFKSKTDVIGHEHVHNLQKIDVGEYDPYDNSFQQDLRHTMREQHVLTRMFNKRISLRKMRWVDNFLSEGILSYLGSDVELQARLHTLVAHGSKRWRQLPQDHPQLWQGLIEAGLKAPKEIKEMVESYFEQNPDQSIIVDTSVSAKFNRLARRAFAHEAVEINTVYNSHYIEENKMFFWQETLPYLYGHLLELYGDSKGRIKMNCPDKKVPKMRPDIPQ